MSATDPLRWLTADVGLRVYVDDRRLHTLYAEIARRRVVFGMVLRVGKGSDADTNGFQVVPGNTLHVPCSILSPYRVDSNESGGVSLELTPSLAWGTVGGKSSVGTFPGYIISGADTLHQRRKGDKGVIG